MAAQKYKEAVTVDAASDNPAYLRDGLINLGAVLIMWRQLLLSKHDSKKSSSDEGSGDSSQFFEYAKYFIETLRGREKNEFDMDSALNVLNMLTNCVESAVAGDAINLLKRINSSVASGTPSFNMQFQYVRYTTLFNARCPYSF